MELWSDVLKTQYANTPILQYPSPSLMDHAHPALSSFIEALSSGDKKKIRAAVDGLIALALEEPEINERLRSLLDETPPERRWPIAYVLAHASPLTPACVAALKETLGSSDPDLRWAVAVLLVRLAKESHPNLIAQLAGLLRSGAPTQRRMAVYCLRDIGAQDEDTSRALIGALGDADALVRVAMITSLKAMPKVAGEALEILLRMFVEDADMRVRASAALALARFGAGRNDVRAALDDASRSNDPILSKAARAALQILEKI